MFEFSRPIALLALLLLPLAWWWMRVPATRVASDRVDLWRRALARLGKRRRHSVWQRVVMSLALAALVLACAGLRIPEIDGLRRRITVLDASTSMLVRDVGGSTRLRAALVDSLDRALPKHVDDRLYAAIGTRVFRVPGEDIDECEAHVLRTRAQFAEDAQKVVDLAVCRGLALRAGSQCHARVLSDGAGDTVWPSGGEAFEFRSYGSPESKVPRIVDAKIEDPWPGPEVTVRLRVLDLPPNPALELRRAGAPVRRLDLPTGEENLELRLVRAPGVGLASRLTLVPSMVAPEFATLRVQVRGAWSPWLWSSPDVDALRVLASFCVRALDASTVEDFDDYRARVGAASAPGLLLRDGGALAAWPEDRSVRVLFGTRLPGFGELRSVEGLPVWDRSRRLLAGLDLGALVTPEAELLAPRGQVSLPPDAELLATVAGRPFIVRSRKARLLWFGTRVDDALVQQPALPLLLLRCLPEMLPGPGGGASRVLEMPGAEAQRSIAARAAPESAPAPGRDAWWTPARELWHYACAAAAVALLLLALL